MSLYNRTIERQAIAYKHDAYWARRDRESKRIQNETRDRLGQRTSNPLSDDCYTGTPSGVFGNPFEATQFYCKTGAIFTSICGLSTFLYGSTFYLIYAVGALKGRANSDTKGTGTLFIKISAFCWALFGTSLGGRILARAIEKRNKEKK